METYIPWNGRQKKAEIAILISDKIDLKIKITRDKEGQYIMIKGWIQEEDIEIVNIYAPNIETLQYIRQTLTAKGETDSNSHQCTDHVNRKWIRKYKS